MALLEKSMCGSRVRSFGSRLWGWRQYGLESGASGSGPYKGSGLAVKSSRTAPGTTTQASLTAAASAETFGSCSWHVTWRLLLRGLSKNSIMRWAQHGKRIDVLVAIDGCGLLKHIAHLLLLDFCRLVKQLLQSASHRSN